jgi:glycosyltransferase involved in cell wall biosynthesis
MKIAIWTGPAWETWGPRSLETGIGGSETAAIHVAAELAHRGHTVEVVGQVTPCEHEGVKYSNYLSYTELNGRIVWGRVTGNKYLLPRIECDVFVSSRFPQASRVLKPETKLTVLWCHDIHVGDDRQGLVRGHDLVLCLSNWAKKSLRAFYPEVPEDKIVVTRNGINPSLYRAEPRKEGFRVIYSSSPDRGLDLLLAYWPKIREIRGDAELNVYYGFDTWQKMADAGNDKIAQAQIDLCEKWITGLRDSGVTMHGRVGQTELANAFLSSSMWLYPTSFKETSCITAMEAQAAGALAVATRLAALPETVRYGLLVDPPTSESRYEREFLGHVRAFAERPDNFSDMIQQGREWALSSLPWAQVAEEWEKLFAEKMKTK